jgi:anti-sigma factor RsiW
VSHVTSQLTAYLDRALDAGARGAVEAHLTLCPDCRAQRDRIALALVTLRRLPVAPEPPPQFEQHFYARLTGERARPRGLLRRLPWRFLAPVAAAGAAAALVVGLDLRERGRLERAAGHLELLEDYEAVVSIGDVDEGDAEVVAHLHELGEKP